MTQTNCSKTLDKDIHKEIGLKINALRQCTGMTISELAQSLKISESRLSRYINGRNSCQIPLIVIRECAKIFGVSFSYFFKD